MQFTHHDFYSNFTASIKSGDLSLTNDILANEISDFVVFDTDKIISALSKSDVKVSKDDTDEQIVDLTISNLGDNPKFTKAFAFIIAEGNELINTGGKNDKAKQLKTIDDISAGLNKVSKEISKDKEGFKSATMSQIVSKASQRKEYNRTIWNKDKGMGIMPVLVVVGIVGAFLLFVYYRQKKSLASAIPNMISNSDLTQQPDISAPPTIVQPIPLAPEPIQPIQPVVTHPV